VRIIANCATESITTIPIPDKPYTTVTPADSSFLPTFTSALPLDCPIAYKVAYYDPGDTLWHDFTSVDFITFTNTTLELTLDAQDNSYAPIPLNTYPLKLIGCLWGDVCEEELFSVLLTQNCLISTITVANALIQSSFIINTPITGANENLFQMSDFTGTEAVCVKQWEVTLFTGDTNSNLAMDYPSEFSSSFPSTSVFGGPIFSKSTSSDNLFEVNVLKTLVNTDSNFYYLRARLHFSSTVTSEDFTITELIILPDCSVESVTAAAISDVLYTFN
jgi:hypothetical protein